MKKGKLALVIPNNLIFSYSWWMLRPITNPFSSILMPSNCSCRYIYISIHIRL